jgi:hypothetical protein
LAAASDSTLGFASVGVTVTSGLASFGLALGFGREVADKENDKWEPNGAVKGGTVLAGEGMVGGLKVVGCKSGNSDFASGSGVGD